MNLWLVVALFGLAVMVVFLYAACYVSGSVDDLEEQAELMARLMRVEEADDAD